MKKRTTYDSMACESCGKNVLLSREKDYFMIDDELWHRACRNGGFDDEVLLCKSCAEKFLGRRLTKTDLKAGIPINDKLNWR